MNAAWALALTLIVAACSASPQTPAPAPAPQPKEPTAVSDTKKSPEPTRAPAATETATLANGCFWCAEAVIQRLPGVISVRSGYTGGETKDPSYEDVCSGTTGHAEAVEIAFDPTKIKYEELLDWFWRMHDPTTLDRQGADVGTQYRSAIFWHSEAQRAAAEKSKKDAQGAFKDPIVTEITKAGPFFEAEAYHQDYYDGHTTQGYCRAVIAPKLHKLGLDEKR